jgi:nucleoside-diphosphate-sugar epimerase
MYDLVTGAAGFIGSHLAQALVSRGRRVRALVRQTALSQSLVETGVESVRGDLREPGSLGVALEGIERVFHCAARVADWGDPTEFRATNVEGVANLLAASHAAKVQRFIHLSTTDVYGFPNVSIDETAPYRHRGWPYGDTKIDGEREVWKASREWGLPVTVIRPANVYGVGSLSFVREIADMLREGRMIHLGRSERPAGLCHVDNLVDCILQAADNERAAGQAYNVTDGSDVSWRTFTNLLADTLGVRRPRHVLPRSVAYATGWCLERTQRGCRRPYLTRMAVELLTSDQSFSIEKARRELGYFPRRTFAGSLPELVGWLEERC